MTDATILLEIYRAHECARAVLAMAERAVQGLVAGQLGNGRRGKMQRVVKAQGVGVALFGGDKAELRMLIWKA